MPLAKNCADSSNPAFACALPPRSSFCTDVPEAFWLARWQLVRELLLNSAALEILFPVLVSFKYSTRFQLFRCHHHGRSNGEFMFLMFSAVSGGDFENINPVQVPPQKEVHPSAPQTAPVLARRSAAQLTIAIIQKSVSRIFCIINFQFKCISSASFLSQEKIRSKTSSTEARPPIRNCKSCAAVSFRLGGLAL